MKKKILKIVIGIVAVPTVALGTLYVAREIPVVSQYIIAPLAKVSSSIGLPVMVMPGDNYFKKEAKERYDAAVMNYNRIDDKETLIIGKEQAERYNSWGVSIYQNYNAGVSYADLQIKPYEQFEKEWVEYSKESYKNNMANMTSENIEKAKENQKNANNKIEQQRQLSELYEEKNKAIQSGDNEKAEEIQQQIDEISKEN